MRTALIGFILLVLSSFSYGMSPELQKAVINNSAQYLKVKEIAPNRSPEIDKFNFYTGAPKASSWCMGFVHYNYYEAFLKHNLKNPLPISGRCSLVWKAAKKNPYRYKCISSKRLALGIEKGELADVVIWSNGKVAGSDNFAGHTGLYLGKISNTNIKTIEGNTSPEKSAGSQSNGDGVYYRNRNLNIGKKFQIEGLIQVK
jgi:hypothetical protein